MSLQRYKDLKNYIKRMVFWAQEPLLVECLKRNKFNKNNFLQLVNFEFTFIGKKEIEEKSKGYEELFYTVLSMLLKRKTLIEIAMELNLSFEQVCTFTADGIDRQFIEPLPSEELNSLLFYLAGKIRMGEYFKRIGKINITQLDEALRQQKQIDDSSERYLGIAEILVNLNYITQEEAFESISMKEDSQKPFTMPSGVSGISINTSNDNSIGGDGKKLARLEKENKLLKDQLRKILKLQGK